MVDVRNTPSENQKQDRPHGHITSKYLEIPTYEIHTTQWKRAASIFEQVEMPHVRDLGIIFQAQNWYLLIYPSLGPFMIEMFASIGKKLDAKLFPIRTSFNQSVTHRTCSLHGKFLVPPTFPPENRVHIFDCSNKEILTKCVVSEILLARSKKLKD